MLEGKVAIVTGAGQGMGEATAKLFASAGAKVVVSDVDGTAAEDVAETIAGRGGTAIAVRADVSRSGDVEALVAAAVTEYGRLDCAVNNAGVGPDTHALAELDEAEWDKVTSVNLKGVALCLRSELAQFTRQGDGGAIVNISSVSGLRPQPQNAAYNAAKHGVIGLTKTASLEYSAAGIRVNTICPGAIMTPMLRAAVDAHPASEDDLVAALSGLGRFGRPEEVAEASMWLCSDRASFVTGATLAVDAGYTSR